MASSKPLCLTGSLRDRGPGRPSSPECVSRDPGRPRLASRPGRPSRPFPLRPHLPSQPEAARAPPVTQAEAVPPPAPPPPRSSRCSPGVSLYLRVSQPQNGAEGGNQAPPPAPPRTECAPPRARRRYPARGPLTRDAPLGRRLGHRAGRLRRGEARGGRPDPPEPRGAERQQRSAAAPTPSAEARACPVGALQAQPGWGGKRPERRAGPRGRRSPARHLGTAAAARQARRGHLRRQRGLGGGIRADERVIGSSLYGAPHRMLPRAVPERGGSGFTPQRPSF
ncbi:uncharacterized protein LOC143439926 [Arvicanthis niloticus]|uniref:translation initiation factor IF-2-like n=1 Tax=Arvicanthis niloticus TaxID=61156 RepID=UPI0014867B34|nr:translation initiation factor IF-2-like [Arvicanthis niloticus]